MKKSYLTPAALFACTIVTSSARAANRVPTARARYEQINREEKSYHIVKRKLRGYSPGGVSLRAYLMHGSPRKLVAHFYGDWGEAVEERYFWNNRLFFVLRAAFTYDEQSGKLKSRSHKEDRFYFSNGKLVKWQRGRKPMSLASREAKDYQESMLLTTREFLQEARLQARNE